MEISLPASTFVSIDSEFAGRAVWLGSSGDVRKWSTTRRGWGFLSATAAGGQATLVEWADLDHALLAIYKLSSLGASPSHLTLWQTPSAEMVSFSYTELSDALEDAKWFNATPASGHILLNPDQVEIVDEAVTARMAPVELIDTCREGARVEVRPVSGISSSHSTTEDGTWGQFSQWEAGFANGFRFRSDTAEAAFQGYDCEGLAPAAFLEEQRRSLMTHLRVSWIEDRDSLSGSKIVDVNSVPL